MKYRIISLLISLAGLAGTVAAIAPDVTINYRFTNHIGEQYDNVTTYNGATRTVPFNNLTLGCVGFQVSYVSEGFSAVSLNLQTTPLVYFSNNNYGPSGTWSTYGGTATVGALPLTSTAQGTYTGYGYYPYLAINLATATGTGSIQVTFSCWKSVNYAGLSGGGGGGGGAVSSVFSRTGDVLATGGDYTGGQITNVPGGTIAATDVQAAINELASEKQPVGNYITALTGDGTAAGPGSSTLTLTAVVSAATCGDATHTSQITFDAKGRVTGCTAVSITAGTGDFVGPSSATDNCAVLFNGTTGKLGKNSTICFDSTHNGAIYHKGVTSGGLALSVKNVGGTATTYIYPDDTDSANSSYVLTHGSTATCPTDLDISIYPNNCVYGSWGPAGGTSVERIQRNSGWCYNTSCTASGGISFYGTGGTWAVDGSATTGSSGFYSAYATSVNTTDSFMVNFTYPSGVTQIDLIMQGVTIAISGVTMTQTATLGCVSAGSSFSSGGGTGTPVAVNVTSATSGNQQTITIPNIGRGSCTANDMAYMVVSRSGTYTGGFSMQSATIVITH